jgi:hypothetical protein
MMKNILVLLSFFGFHFFAFSQAPSLSWQKYYGGSGTESMDIILELDNGYLIEGGTTSSDGDVNGFHGTGDIWIIRIDSIGNLIWQRCFGGSGSESLGRIIKTANGRFIIAGGTTSNNGDVRGNHNSGTFDGWIAEFDSSGNIIRQKCFGGSGNDGFDGLILTNDGGYIAGGITSSTDGDLNGSLNHGGGDMWVVKLDSSWNIVWQQCFGGSQQESAAKIISVKDNYIIYGYTNSNDGNISSSHGDYDYWLVKLDSVGNLIWEKTYGGSNSDFCFWNILNYWDSGYILGGTTESMDGDVIGNHGSIDYWVLRVDSLGNILWKKCYGGSGGERLNGIDLDTDGGIILAGISNSGSGDVSGIHFGWQCIPYPCEDFWVVKIDSLGNLKWQKCLGGTDGDEAYGIKATNDFGYLAVGTGFSIDGDAAGSNYHGNSDAWVVKLASLPDAISTSSNPITDFACHYTSLSHSVSISFYEDKNETAQFELLDITGRILLQQSFETTNGFNKQLIETANLSTGVYLVRLLTLAGIVSKKMIVE